MLNSTGRGLLAWVVLLTSLLLVGVFGTAGLAADPEPQWPALVETNFDPGPGWPAGWSPPEAPTAISPERQAQHDSINQGLPPEEQATQLLLRVQPAPFWTSQYAYGWKYGYTDCGKTRYLYYYAYPDLDIMKQLTGEIDTIGAPFVAQCHYRLVTSISKTLKPRPEEIERATLSAQMQEDLRAARKGLEDCPDWSNNSSGSIQVCFNGGDASRTFDVAAYLDVEVSRVRVPVRFVSELMGAQVTWNEVKRQVTVTFPETSREVVKLVSKPGFTPADWWDATKNLDYHTYDLKSVTISQPARTIVLTVGQTTAYVNGQPVTIDAPPVIVPAGRTMVPLRFISEQLGADVYWIGNEPIFTSGGQSRGTYQVHIYTQFHPWSDAPTWYLKRGE